MLPRCVPNNMTDVIVPMIPGLMKMTTTDRNAKNIPVAKTRDDFTFGRFEMKGTKILVTKFIRLYSDAVATAWSEPRPT